jgi:hypothetical protein
VIMNYLSDQMLRNLEPQRLTKAQQREADEQLGAAVAAVSRRTSRVIRRLHAWALQTVMADRRARSFRKYGGQTGLPRCTGACQDRDDFAHALRK